MKTNEIGRYVVKLVLGPNSDYWREKYGMFSNGELFIAVEKNHGQHEKVTHKSVSDSIQWGYSVVASLCNTRCIAAERGDLLVDGASIQAEKYMRLWRAAMDKPISLEQLLAMGVLPVLRITKSYPRLQTGSAIDWLHADEWIESQNEIQTTWKIALRDHVAMVVAQAISDYISGDYSENLVNQQVISLERIEIAVPNPCSSEPMQATLFANTLDEVAA